MKQKLLSGLEQIRGKSHLWQAIQQFIELSRIHWVQRFGAHTVTVLGKTYRVSKDVFNPKYFENSTLLADHIQVRPGDEVLDMGTGSGIQAIMAAQTVRKVVAIDINPEAVRCAVENIKRNGLERVVSVLSGDLFEPLPLEACFDVIIFNAPFWDRTAKSYLEIAMFDPGQRVLKRFLQNAAHYLKPGGNIQILYSSSAETGSNRKLVKAATEFGWKCGIVHQKIVSTEIFTIYKLTL